MIRVPTSAAVAWSIVGIVVGPLSCGMSAWAHESHDVQHRAIGAIAPRLSPDGKRLAYIHSHGFTAGTLAVMDAKTGTSEPSPSEVAVMDKLHFDPSGERVLGVFQPLNERPRLAWLHLTTGDSPLQTPIEGSAK